MHTMIIQQGSFSVKNVTPALRTINANEFKTAIMTTPLKASVAMQARVVETQSAGQSPMSAKNDSFSSFEHVKNQTASTTNSMSQKRHDCACSKNTPHHPPNTQQSSSIPSKDVKKKRDIFPSPRDTLTSLPQVSKLVEDLDKSEEEDQTEDNGEKKNTAAEVFSM